MSLSMSTPGKQNFCLLDIVGITNKNAVCSLIWQLRCKNQQDGDIGIGTIRIVTSTTSVPSPTQKPAWSISICFMVLVLSRTSHIKPQ